MPALFIRVMLFLCSFFPLILIVCILAVGAWPLWGILSLASIGVASLPVTWFYLSFMRRKLYTEHKKVVKFSRRDSEVMGYIAAYLIPFLTFQLSNWQHSLALGVFVAVLLIIYVHSNMIYINPMLNLMGFHLYEIEIEHGRQPHYFIARKPLERNSEIHFVTLSDTIFLEK